MKSFTCRTCGSHRIQVFHEYNMTFYCTDVLPCNCGGRKRIAAIRKYHDVTNWDKTGYLDNDHFWSGGQYGTTARLNGLVETVEDKMEVYCKTCFGEATSEAWERDRSDGKTIIEEDHFDFWVFCGRCKREIEFGWSKPDRVGQIWPVECSDFNPLECWADPRYRREGTKRGWPEPS